MCKVNWQNYKINTLVFKMIEEHRNQLKKHYYEYINEKKIDKSLLKDEYLEYGGGLHWE